MIIGEYPCCDGPLTLDTQTYHMFAKENCPHCGKPVWHWLSMINPGTWTEDHFLETHDVNETQMKITKRTQI
jgi:hypothetical protein